MGDDRCCTAWPLSVGADVACTSQGGQCVDWRNYKCTAGVATGLCNGDANRRCCLACSSTCLSNEQTWSQSDGGCTGSGGTCQINSNYCAGYYASGKCGGPSNRQCCLKSSGNWATICAGQSSNRVRGCDSQGCGHYGAPRGDRQHMGADVVCNDGSVVYSPFTGTLQGQAKPYGDGSAIDDGVKLSGSGYCVLMFYLRPDSYTGSVSSGQRIGYLLNMQSVYPGITSHVHVQMCDKSDPTPFL
uniref:Leukocyte cell-derived chemotaxin-2-like n=1 Tax=Petromyzon marinus TaxID=7757 RepID=A0AAJ7T4D8_PETMA|nr:leukocyte cell-derived chemotaxin-2-like [Petromyzon marinus]